MDQSEIQNAISEVINTLGGINSGLDEAENWISNLEGKVEENTKSKSKNRNLKNENSLGDFGDNMKYNNICIMGIPEGEEREQGIENLFEEIVIENFLNLVKEKDTQD